jgi:hypothetical protein
MRVACRRVLLPFLSIVLSPRGGGVDGASTSPGPLPPPLAVKEEIESVNSVPHSPSDRSCAPGTTSITGRRRFPPHVSIMIRLVILFIWGRGGWGGNHVRDELQKPRLLISRPISWGFTKYFLTAIRDHTPPPPPPCRAPCFFFYASPCSRSCSSHSVEFFPVCTAAGLDDGDCFVVVSRHVLTFSPSPPEG